jgi:hypothetical protein
MFVNALSRALSRIVVASIRVTETLGPRVAQAESKSKAASERCSLVIVGTYLGRVYLAR